MSFYQRTLNAAGRLVNSYNRSNRYAHRRSLVEAFGAVPSVAAVLESYRRRGATSSHPALASVPEETPNFVEVDLEEKMSGRSGGQSVAGPIRIKCTSTKLNHRHRHRKRQMLRGCLMQKRMFGFTVYRANYWYTGSNSNTSADFDIGMHLCNCPVTANASGIAALGMSDLYQKYKNLFVYGQQNYLNSAFNTTTQLGASHSIVKLPPYSLCTFFKVWKDHYTFTNSGSSTINVYLLLWKPRYAFDISRCNVQNAASQVPSFNGGTVMPATLGSNEFRQKTGANGGYVQAGQSWVDTPSRSDSVYYAWRLVKHCVVRLQPGNFFNFDVTSKNKLVDWADFFGYIPWNYAIKADTDTTGFAGVLPQYSKVLQVYVRSDPNTVLANSASTGNAGVNVIGNVVLTIRLQQFIEFISSVHQSSYFNQIQQTMAPAAGVAPNVVYGVDAPVPGAGGANANVADQSIALAAAAAGSHMNDNAIY